MTRSVQARRSAPAPTRARIVAETRAWVGTPYCHQASLKGVGCDCLGLVRGVWRAFYGPEPESLPAYSADWAETTKTESLARAAARHMEPLAPDAFGAADVVLFRWRDGLPAKHAAIICDGHTFIHAYDRLGVAEGALSDWWRRRIAYAFRFPGVR